MTEYLEGRQDVFECQVCNGVFDCIFNPEPSVYLCGNCLVTRKNRIATHDFGDVTHGQHTDGSRCIYCDMSRDEAVLQVCPEYDNE